MPVRLWDTFTVAYGIKALHTTTRGNVHKFAPLPDPVGCKAPNHHCQAAQQCCQTASTHAHRTQKTHDQPRSPSTLHPPTALLAATNIRRRASEMPRDQVRVADISHPTFGNNGHQAGSTQGQQTPPPPPTGTANFNACLPSTEPTNRDNHPGTGQRENKKPDLPALIYLHRCESPCMEHIRPPHAATA